MFVFFIPTVENVTDRFFTARKSEKRKLATKKKKNENFSSIAIELSSRRVVKVF